jgi:hypothetical protein
MKAALAAGDAPAHDFNLGSAAWPCRSGARG